ncbi:MAG: hypothetical protein AAF442_01835 [Pseudomonadota bacterium]
MNKTRKTFDGHDNWFDPHTKRLSIPERLFYAGIGLTAFIMFFVELQGIFHQ